MQRFASLLRPPSSPVPGLMALARGFSSSDLVSVIFVDPRTAIENPDSASGQGLEVSIARNQLADLKKAHQQLGDYDEPINHWVMGREGEIFQYTLLGAVGTSSGFVAAMKKDDIAGLKGLSFQELRSRYSAVSEAGRALTDFAPFVFVGHILEASGANVYALKDGAKGEASGLLVTSGDEIA